MDGIEIIQVGLDNLFFPKWTETEFECFFTKQAAGTQTFNSFFMRVKKQKQTEVLKQFSGL